MLKLLGSTSSLFGHGGVLCLESDNSDDEPDNDSADGDVSDYVNDSDDDSKFDSVDSVSA